MGISIKSVSGTARGFKVGSYTYIWDGYSYFPTYGYQGFPLDYFTFDGVSLVTPKTSWDCTNYWLGHESMFFLLLLEYDTSQDGYYYIAWYDPDGNLLLKNTYYIKQTVKPGWRYQQYTWVGMGMAINNGSTRVNEIYKNGTYKIKVTGLVTKEYSVSATNINSDRMKYYNTSDKGSVWVEGDSLYMITGDKYKIKIRNDGVNYGTATAGNAGNIWIPDVNTTKPYLMYIDSSNIIRRTHIGDIYGTSGYWDTTDTIVNVGSQHAGYIWMRNYWSFIMYVTFDGYKCRIGPGYLYGNGP